MQGSKNYNSLKLSITGEVVFKAFWRGTYNWRVRLLSIALEFSRLGKTEEEQKGKEGFEISDFREKITGFRIPGQQNVGAGKCGMTKADLAWE